MSENEKIFLFFSFIAFFLLRICFSFINDFWDDYDIREVFLIGLRYYTTGVWPYWGPDIIHTQSQIPGALLGWIIGVPLFIHPSIASTVIFKEFILTSSLIYFCWYLFKTTKLSLWFIIFYVFSLPWIMLYGTRFINPAFILPGAILFTIGVLDVVIFRSKYLPRILSFFQIGFGVIWVFQLHMSWVIFIPVCLYSFYFNL